MGHSELENLYVLKMVIQILLTISLPFYPLLLSSFLLVILLLILLTSWVSIIDRKPGCHNLKNFLNYICVHQISICPFQSTEIYQTKITNSVIRKSYGYLPMTHIQEEIFSSFGGTDLNMILP